MVPNEEFHILKIQFEPLKRGQNVWSQGVLYMEVPLYQQNIINRTVFSSFCSQSTPEHTEISNGTTDNCILRSNTECGLYKYNNLFNILVL